MRDTKDVENHSEESTSTIDDSTYGEQTNDGWVFEAQAHFDPAEPRDLTTVVIGAIAEAEVVPITEVKSPTLFEVVDITGIEAALFGRPDENRTGTDSTVEFRFNELKVSVKDDGWVTVSRRGDPHD